MPREQTKFSVVPDRPGRMGNGPVPQDLRRPMTTKQARKEYLERTRGPKLSKAQQQERDRQLQEEIRRELKEKEKQEKELKERERRLRKAHVLREKKQAKEDAENEAKRKAGVPLKPPRPSQPTLAGFFRGPAIKRKRGEIQAEVREKATKREESESDKENDRPDRPEVVPEAPVSATPISATPVGLRKRVKLESAAIHTPRRRRHQPSPSVIPDTPVSNSTPPERQAEHPHAAMAMPAPLRPASQRLPLPRPVDGLKPAIKSPPKRRKKQKKSPDDGNDTEIPSSDPPPPAPSQQSAQLATIPENNVVEAAPPSAAPPMAAPPIVAEQLMAQVDSMINLEDLEDLFPSSTQLCRELLDEEQDDSGVSEMEAAPDTKTVGDVAPKAYIPPPAAEVVTTPRQPPAPVESSPTPLDSMPFFCTQDCVLSAEDLQEIETSPATAVPPARPHLAPPPLPPPPHVASVRTPMGPPPPRPPYLQSQRASRISARNRSPYLTRATHAKTPMGKPPLSAAPSYQRTANPKQYLRPSPAWKPATPIRAPAPSHAQEGNMAQQRPTYQTPARPPRPPRENPVESLVSSQDMRALFNEDWDDDLI